LDRIVDVAKKQIDSLGPILNKTVLLQAVLIGIEYCRCTTDYELFALLIALMPVSRQDRTKKHHSATEEKDKNSTPLFTIPLLPSRTSLVIIDSISNLMRSPIPDGAQQLRIQRSQLMNELRQFAEDCRSVGIKLVLSNQMSLTIVGTNGYDTNLGNNRGQARLAPLLRDQEGSVLGDNVWRLILFRHGPQGIGTFNRFAQFTIRPPSAQTNELEICLQFRVDRGGVQSHFY
jgi:hypothetical protein